MPRPTKNNTAPAQQAPATSGDHVTGIRRQRLRRVAAVAVLACLLSSLSSAAWAGDGHGRSGHRSERSAGDERRGESTQKHDRRTTQRRGHEGREHEGRERQGRARLEVRAGKAKVRAEAAKVRAEAKVARASGKQQAKAKHEDRQAQAQKRGPKPDVRVRPSARKTADRDGFVTASSVDDDRGKQDTQRGRKRREADARRREAEAEVRAQRFREALGRSDETAPPAPEPETSPDVADEPETTVEAAGAEQPAREDDQVVAGVVAAPASPASPEAAAAPAAEPAPAPEAAASPSVDVLAHEHGVVDRTFRAGGALLRDTGRAVAQALPPQTRTYGLPLGLLAALGGYLVVQRRFRSGQLPMSAAAVPMQETARERHRL